MAHPSDLLLANYRPKIVTHDADEGTDGSGIMAQTPKHQTGAKVSAIPRQARGDV